MKLFIATSPPQPVRLTGQLRSPLWISMSMLVVLAQLCLTFVATPSYAAVKFFDGFGDADLDNNGVPLEAYDVDAGDSAFDDAGGLNTVLTYVPARIDTGVPTDPTNAEVTTVLDANDVGIKWFQIRGFTGSNDGRSKPTARIVDDTTGAMLETAALGPAGALGNNAIDSGYALSANSRGRGSSIAGFFGENIALGPEVGDSVKVSFDFRIWRDAPALNNVLQPEDAELRFGLFQDTDNQLGMANPVAGRSVDTNNDGFLDPVPAVWGEEEGQFEGIQVSGTAGSEIGAPGDAGWFGAVILEDPNGQFPPVIPNGGGWRIREETNLDEGGGTVDLRILQGASDTVAVPQESSPGAGDFGLTNLNVNNVWRLSLELVRATEAVAGDTMTAILTATDITGGTPGNSFTLMDTEPLMRDDGMGGMEPDGITSDNWDYFAIRNTGLDDFDMILDNFSLEVSGSNAGADLDGDFDDSGLVGQGDLDLVLLNWGDTPPPVPNGWINEQPSGLIGQGSLDKVLLNWGNTALSSPVAGVPEPAGVALLLLGLSSLGSMRRYHR